MDVSEKNSSQPTLSLEKPIESQGSPVFLQATGSKLWRTRHPFHLRDSQSLMLYHQQDFQTIIFGLFPTIGYPTE